MLLQQFKHFITQKKLFQPSDKVLLAVSGGVDSMVLLHLCLDAGYNFAVAHVNFNLRAEASDADEKLVIETCKKNNITCYSTKVDTLACAANHKLSIQMAARELRYRYFNNLVSEHQFTSIVTAHHADDTIETFFINLLRSTGIKGLTGIPVQNGELIRPLLFASRNQIEAYAQEHQITFRTDSSNLNDHYLRNHIRHHVIPALNSAADNAGEQILNTMQHLQTEADLLQELHHKAFENMLSIHIQGICINKNLLQSYSNPQTMLFMYLKNYGFNISQVKDMMALSVEKSGSKFYSDTHIALLNRNEIIVSELESEKKDVTLVIENIHQEITEPICLSMKMLALQEAGYKHAHANEAFVDADKVLFPLKLRKWQAGDTMQPLGMNQRKKVSDILIDNKVDLFTKANTYVVCNAQNEIVWLIGQRVSALFKVENNSKNILHISRASFL